MRFTRNLQETKMYEISKMEDKKILPSFLFARCQYEKWVKYFLLFKPGKIFTFLLFFWRFFFKNRV